jgi:hypothetical protein
MLFRATNDIVLIPGRAQAGFSCEHGRFHWRCSVCIFRPLTLARRSHKDYSYEVGFADRVRIIGAILTAADPGIALRIDCTNVNKPVTIETPASSTPLLSSPGRAVWACIGNLSLLSSGFSRT